MRLCDTYAIMAFEGFENLAKYLQIELFKQHGLVLEIQRGT